MFLSPSLLDALPILAYVTRRNGAFRIAILDLHSEQEQLITNGPDDQSPSFAPNGQQILYSTVQDGKSVLAVTSVDGRVRQTLSALNGTVREPTWGPLTDYFLCGPFLDRKSTRLNSTHVATSY